MHFSAESYVVRLLSYFQLISELFLLRVVDTVLGEN